MTKWQAWAYILMDKRQKHFVKDKYSQNFIAREVWRLEPSGI
jgi:hypothetical protein